MPAIATVEKIVRRFLAAFNELYGDRIERVVLFGSRARFERMPWNSPIARPKAQRSLT